MKTRTPLLTTTSLALAGGGLRTVPAGPSASSGWRDTSTARANPGSFTLTVQGGIMQGGMMGQMMQRMPAGLHGHAGQCRRP